MDLTLIGNTGLRSAIQRNLVSFPSQIPAFMKRGDVQERIVQLYFVRRWPINAICSRYGLGRSTVRKLLSDWRIRAIAAGYIQEIHPEVVADLAIDADIRRQEEREESDLNPDIESLRRDWRGALPVQHDHVLSSAARP